MARSITTKTPRRVATGRLVLLSRPWWLTPRVSELPFFLECLRPGQSSPRVPSLNVSG